MVRRLLSERKSRALKDHEMKNRLGVTSARHAGLSSVPARDSLNNGRRCTGGMGVVLAAFVKDPATTDEDDVHESRLGEALIRHSISNFQKLVGRNVRDSMS